MPVKRFDKTMRPRGYQTAADITRAYQGAAQTAADTAEEKTGATTAAKRKESKK